MTACVRKGAGARGAANTEAAAARTPGLVRVYEDRAAEAARDAPRRETSIHGTANLEVAAIMNARLDRRYEDMAEEMVREVFGLRDTGFPPEYPWHRVFVPLIWGLAPRWRATLETGWRQMNGNMNLLRALFASAEARGITEPTDIAPMARKPRALGYIQSGAQERFLASTRHGLALDAELGRLAGLYDGVMPAD